MSNLAQIEVRSEESLSPGSQESFLAGQLQVWNLPTQGCPHVGTPGSRGFSLITYEDSRFYFVASKRQQKDELRVNRYDRMTHAHENKVYSHK